MISLPPLLFDLVGTLDTPTKFCSICRTPATFRFEFTDEYNIHVCRDLSCQNEARRIGHFESGTTGMRAAVNLAVEAQAKLFNYSTEGLAALFNISPFKS